MDKSQLVGKIITELEKELAIIDQSARGAREEALASESVPESQLDHRSIEAKRLAEVQTSRAEEARQRIQLYKNMPLKEFDEAQGIDLGAVVKVSHNKDVMYFFLAPKGAGITVDFEGHPVEVITPKAPLGEALMDRTAGETAVIESPKGEQSYDILSVH